MRILGYSVGLLVLVCFASQVRADTITWTQWETTAGGNGHWYGVVRTGAGAGYNWTDARDAAISVGGQLVTIDDADENSWLLSTFPKSAEGVLWIGLSAPSGSYWSDLSTWEWTDGSASTFRDWRTGQPDYGYGNDRYTVLNFSSGGWDNYPHDGWQGVPAGLVERAPNPVPLPASAAMALVGLAFAFAGRRLRRKA